MELEMRMGFFSDRGEGKEDWLMKGRPKRKNRRSTLNRRAGQNKLRETEQNASTRSRPTRSNRIAHPSRLRANPPSERLRRTTAQGTWRKPIARGGDRRRLLELGLPGPTVKPMSP